MSYLLAIIPFFALVSGILVYRLNGHREVFRLDVIQFFYAFVLSPLLFVWAKSVLFLTLRSELGVHLSQRSLFFYDTIFSVFFLYIFAFVVMHSLTKSFSLKMWSNPKYNLFLDSEYLHVWLTHIVMFVGGLTLLSIIGLVNGFFPLPVSLARHVFYTLNGVGFLTGILAFIGIIPLSDPNQRGRNFKRLMKLTFGLLFMLHVVALFLFEIPFNSSRLIYWSNSFFFAALVTCSALVRSSKIRAMIDRMTLRLKHEDWDTRLQVFGKRSK